MVDGMCEGFAKEDEATCDHHNVSVGMEWVKGTWYLISDHINKGAQE